MAIVSKYSFHFSFVFLIILFGSSPPYCNAQEETTDQTKRGLALKPLQIITGEEYREDFFIAIEPWSKKMGLLDAEKKEILPIIFDEVYSGLVNPHYVAVYENRQKGLFNLEGKRICESIYSGFILSPADSSIIGAYLGQEEGWSIINNKGARIFSENYAKIEFLQKGLVILQKEDLSSSLASIHGELITDFKFQLLQGISKNKIDEKWYVENNIVATAVEGFRTIFINSKGEIVDQ